MLFRKLVPYYDRWGDRWRAQLLAMILFFGILLTTGPLLVELVNNRGTSSDFKLLFAILGFEIAIAALWRWRGLDVAANLFVIGSQAIVLEATFLSGGLTSSLAYAEVFVVAIAALLTSPKITIGVVGTAVSFNLGLYYLASTQQLPPSILDDSLITRLIIQFSIMALAAATILYANYIRAGLTSELSANEIRFRSLFEKTSDAVFLIGLDWYLIEANAQAANLLGYRQHELVGMDIQKLFSAAEWSKVEERLKVVSVDQVLVPAEQKFLTKNGEEIILETNLALVQDEDGELLHYQSIGRDITDKVMEEQRIRSTLAHMTVRASTDALTGVLNREAVMQHARAEWDRYRRESTPMSLMLVDLDGLKTINDTHGHLVGDAALRTLAQLLDQNKRPYDWIGRFGGDEFMVVLPGASWDDAQVIRQRVAKAVNSQTLRTAGSSVDLRCSVGVASTDNPETPAGSVTELLKIADAELYRMKGASGRALGANAFPLPDLGKLGRGHSPSKSNREP